MRFAVIDPKAKTVSPVEADDVLALARERIGEGLDHTSLTRSLGMWVYEFGLYVPKEQADYFSIGQALFVGTAVLYQVDELGETITLDDGINWLYKHSLRFYRDWQEVEQAIQAREIQRPTSQVTSGGHTKVYWRWPEPKPDLGAMARDLATKH